MKKVLKYLYGVGFIILFLWGIWAFLPYLCFLTGMTADEDHAIRNILAGYELPVFIIILMGLITLAILIWQMFSNSSISHPHENIITEFPWFNTTATQKQRVTFEKELRRLCAACQSGSKGTTKPLVEWLLAQQSAGIILLPDNYTQIHQELAEHYGYGLSKQSFSAAMPAKVQ